MASAREIEETVARCVATMACYRGSKRKAEAKALMVIEIEIIAGFVAEGLRMDDGEVDRLIVQPLRVELIDRYGHELGTRLVCEFIGVFERTPPLSEHDHLSRFADWSEPRWQQPPGGPSCN